MSSTFPDLKGRSVAVVTIDMHRGHLDPDVATMPLLPERAERVTAANKVLVDVAREKGVPVVHVITQYNSEEEIASNPWWKAVSGTGATRSNVLKHQVPGVPGLDLMPTLAGEGDMYIRTKRRYDSFAYSDLDFVLRRLGVDTLLLTGVNTNSCVLATTVAGNALDYTVIVVEECVDTMDPVLHDPALAVIRQAFGWVGSLDEVTAAL